jgi:hypothetical protein
MSAVRIRAPGLALLSFVAAADLAAQGANWPPPGPRWETEPAKAFARAREQRRAVLAYVADNECPHCAAMAREAWPTEAVRALDGEVVFLAVHRDRDVDWTTRLGVLAYPQVLFLDGFGELLPGGRDHVHARSSEDLVAAVRAFAGERASDARPPALPESLLAAVPQRLRRAVGSPDCDVRIAAWRRLVPRLAPAQLALLFGSETDALARLEALRAMPGDRKHQRLAVELATAGLGDPNDYVREASIERLAAAGGLLAGEALAGVIDAVLGGESGYANPNNMLCSAAQAAATVAEPCLIEALGRILEREGAGNNATHLAVAALAAIGEKHGRDRVRAALERALRVEGLGAEMLHSAARAALRD